MARGGTSRSESHFKGDGPPRGPVAADNLGDLYKGLKEATDRLRASTATLKLRPGDPDLEARVEADVDLVNALSERVEALLAQADPES